MLFKSKFKKLEIPLLIITALVIFYALYLVFLVVPNEKVMGPVQRIFYFHVGSAIACYFSCAIILIASLGYLATQKIEFDLLLQSAAGVGFVFCLAVMGSGMIWGHSAWNTWFRWEPRLVSFLILLLILAGLNILRQFGEPARLAQHCAILGILSALSVPLVVFSINLLPQFAQLHPQVVSNRGLEEPSFIQAMFVSMAGLVLFQFQLIWLRFRIALLERSPKEMSGIENSGHELR